MHGNFLPLAPSPQIPFPPCEFFFCSCPPPSPPTLHFSGKEEAGNSYLPRSTFPNMNDFSAEYIKDLIITQRKTLSEVSLLLKERFPDKKGFSSRSVRRFCFESGITKLHNCLSNDELEECTRDVVARVRIS